MRRISCQHRVWVVAALLVLVQLPAFAQSSVDKAWTTLQSGLADKGAEGRTAAVHALGLLEGNSKAAQLALSALSDGSPEVRGAAAESLGRMKARSAVPKLQASIKTEKEASVVLASARSLIALGDPLGYAVFYSVLTGELKTGGALLEEQRQMLKDPKKMATFGFEQGIGFVPYAGVGYKVFKVVDKDDTSPVRAAAATVLADDRDPRSGAALTQATSDKSWLVRAAAFDALARRGDRSLVPQMEPGLADENATARYTAAAAIIHLHDVPISSAR